MENLQVYNARFGTKIVTIEANLHRLATSPRRTTPASFGGIGSPDR